MMQCYTEYFFHYVHIHTRTHIYLRTHIYIGREREIDRNKERSVKYAFENIAVNIKRTRTLIKNIVITFR